jgi:peptide/nickel transport system substrate-binding protein
LTRRTFLKGLALGAGGIWWGRIPSAFAVSVDRLRTLVIGLGRDFFDGPDSRTYLHGSTHTWEALTYLDRNLQAKPWLAESWKVEDQGRTWTFVIRPKVFFHDGTPVKVEHILENLKRMRSHPHYDPTGIYKNVRDMGRRGEGRVCFRLEEPSPVFANLLAYYSSPVLHPGGFDDRGRIKELQGTGPFQVEEIRRGERIVLKAFDRYWGTKPHFERVVFRTILDAHSRIMALQAGTMDAVADVGGLLPEQALLLQKDPNIRLKQQEVATTHYLFFNCSRPPFHRREHRLWLAGLAEVKGWVKALTYGFSREAQGFYSPLAKDWLFPVRGPAAGEKPPAMARTLTLLLSQGTVQRWPYLELAQLFQERLNGQGFPTRIQVLETGPYQEAQKKRDFDLLIQPNTLMTGDPDFFYSYYVHSTGTHNFGFRNAQADRLIASARRETDLGLRKALYGQLSDLMWAYLPVLPLYHDLSCYAHRKNIRRFDLDQNFRPDLIGAEG